MTTTINASTSSGLINTADTSGILQLQTANTAALTIDASQNVGVGTASPSAKLDVNSGIVLVGPKSASSATAGIIGLRDDTSATRWYTGILQQPAATSYTIYDSIASQSRLTIDSSGNLGLGVTPATWTTYKAISIAGTGQGIAGSSGGESHLLANTYYNSGWKYAATQGAARFSIGESFNDFRWYNAASGAAGSAVSFTQAMTLDASGRLLLGTTTAPSGGSATQVISASNGGLQLHSTSQVGGALLSSAVASGGLGFYTYTGNVGSESYSERARIDSSGNLLIGTTVASGKGRLTVENTNVSNRALYVEGYPSGLPTATIYRDNTDAQYLLEMRCDTSVIGSGGTSLMIRFQDRNGSTLGTIQSSGTGAGSTSYNTSSDYRLKNSVQPMTGALAKVALLKPCTYKWNPDNTDGQGFIAHELQELFPEAVTGEKDGIEEYLDETDNTVKTRPRYQGIDTSFLVATLTAALQEQQAIIETLTQRITALEGA